MHSMRFAQNTTWKLILARTWPVKGAFYQSEPLSGCRGRSNLPVCDAMPYGLIRIFGFLGMQSRYDDRTGCALSCLTSMLKSSLHPFTLLKRGPRDEGPG